jgi:predicted porin
MKIRLLQILVGAIFVGQASAQSNITMFGMIDGGVRRVTNVNAAGDDRLTVGSNGTHNLNRIGFRGVEDLGGMDVHFVLETGFNSGTGTLDNTANRLFQRNAYVGVTGQWGSIDVGRQTTNAFQTIVGYDPLSYKYSGFNLAIGAIGGLRNDNNIKYTKVIGPVTARVEYSPGEVAGSTRTNSAASASAGYKNNALYVGAVYTRRNVAGFDNDSWSIGGAHQFGAARISAGYAHQEQDAAVSSQKTRWAWTGLNYAISPVVEITAAYYQAKLTGLTRGEKSMAILAATYALSKRTVLYVDYDITENKGVQAASPAQQRQHGTSIGVNHTF